MGAPLLQDFWEKWGSLCPVQKTHLSQTRREMGYPKFYGEPYPLNVL